MDANHVLRRVSSLPILTRQKLCRHLDADNGWKDLACSTGLDAIDVALIEQRCAGGLSSPTDQMLLLWTQRKVPRVLQLYTILCQQGRVLEMDIIEHLIPPHCRVRRAGRDYGSMQLFMTTDIRRENVEIQQAASLASAQEGSDASSRPGMLSASPTPASAALRLALPRFSFDEIRTATRDFSEEMLIGRGRFSCVFKCTMRNTTYAVKRKATRADDKSLDVELELMQSYPHENILPVYGCCITADKIFLCCQFMANGSLADRLSSTAVPLLCEQRCHIAVGAARGLQYLHSLPERPIIHGNVKSSNILLDKHLEAKLSDFSLAKHATGGSTAERLTHYTKEDVDPLGVDPAYAAPELMEAVGCQRPSTKSDTYSFGIVMLEVCTGLKAASTRTGSGVDWLRTYVEEMCTGPNTTLGAAAMKLADPRIKWDDVFFLELLVLAQSCCSHLKRQRPDMGQVFSNLQRLDAGLQIRQRSTVAMSGALRNRSAIVRLRTHHEPTRESDSSSAGFDDLTDDGSSLGYDLTVNSFNSSSTGVATISAGVPCGSASSLGAASQSVSDQGGLILEDSSNSSWSPLADSRNVMSPRPLCQAASSEGTLDGDASSSSTSALPKEAPAPVPDWLGNYMQEWGSANDDEEDDASVLLEGLESMTFVSHEPTESSLSD